MRRTERTWAKFVLTTLQAIFLHSSLSLVSKRIYADSTAELAFLINKDRAVRCQSACITNYSEMSGSSRSELLSNYRITNSENYVGRQAAERCAPTPPEPLASAPPARMLWHISANWDE